MGFEPTVPLRVHTPSKRAPSATRSSLPGHGWREVAAVHGCTSGRRHTDVQAATPMRPKTRAPQGPHEKGSRREWDSNPRSRKRLNGFRDRPIRPLSHLSERMRVPHPPRTSTCRGGGRPLRAQEDSNLRPLDPQSNALSRLSYGHTTERRGFEPLIPLRVQRLSRAPDSATLAPLQVPAGLGVPTPCGPEREGFEPPEPRSGSTVFKTASFDHSDTSPRTFSAAGAFHYTHRPGALSTKRG